MKKLLTALLVGVCLNYTVSVPCLAEIAIVVNTGLFEKVAAAAGAEKQVDWMDGDLADDRACTECFAATELAGFLVRSKIVSQAEIEWGSPESMPGAGHVFLLGSVESNPLIAARDNGKRTALKTRQSYHIRATEEDGRIVTVIEGADRVGVLYGVYEYLEALGVRFYGLGETGTVYPGEGATLPASLDLVGNPSFLSRGYCATERGGNTDFFLWMARNRINYWPLSDDWKHFLKKLGVKLTWGGHNHQHEFLGPQTEYAYNHPKFQGDEDKPSDPYALGSEYAGDVDKNGKLTNFEAHPEWYSLRDGKRSDKIAVDFGDNYCTSNMDAGKELAKNLVQALIDGSWRDVDIVDFWMLDGGTWCQCKSCEAQGSYTDRMFVVAHTVLQEIRAARASGRLAYDIELGVPAYVETIAPPTRPLPKDFSYENFFVTFFPIQRCYAHTMGGSACTEINKFIRDSYLDWVDGGHFKGSMLIGEYYNVSSHVTLPLVFGRVIAADVPWYYRHGARYFNYMHSPMRRWGTWTLNQRLLAELLWDVETDSKAMLDEYFSRYYPTTTAHTRKFYAHLEEALANVKAFKHGVACTGGDAHYGYTLRKRLAAEDMPELFVLDHLQYETHKPAQNDGPDIVDMVAGMQLARREIDAALIACSDEIERQRLLEDEERFAYGEAMVQFYYRIVRTAIFHRRGEETLARREFEYVEEMAMKLQGITDLVHVSASTGADAENGLMAALHWPTGVNPYAFYQKKYGQGKLDQ
jgi:hypothetical protein